MSRQPLAAWVLLFAAGIAAGSIVFSQLKTSNGGAGTESVQGYDLLHTASSTGPSAVVLVSGPPAAAASTRASVQALTTRLARLPNVTGAVSAYTSNDPMLRAPDGHASLIVVSVRKNAPMHAQMAVVDAMRSIARHAVPGARVQVGGDLGVNKDGKTGGGGARDGCRRTHESTAHDPAWTFSLSASYVIQDHPVHIP